MTLYLQYLKETRGSKAAAEEAVNVLSWAHSMAGIPSPAAGPFVQTTLEGIRRSLARPVQKKDPVTIDLIADIVEHTDKSCLSDVRLATACLISFAGFLRFDELVNIRCCDVQLATEMATIKIPRSKTDQLRKGDEVVICQNVICYMSS